MSNHPIATLEDLTLFTESLLQSLHAKDRATVLALTGDLGAGKTTFTQTLATQLGVTETVTSPTFVLVKQYTTTHPQFHTLVHFDAYRIEDQSELAPLKLEETLSDPNTIMCIEWPEQCSSIIPADAIKLTFTGLDAERTITLDYYDN